MRPLVAFLHGHTCPPRQLPPPRLEFSYEQAATFTPRTLCLPLDRRRLLTTWLPPPSPCRPFGLATLAVSAKVLLRLDVRLGVFSPCPPLSPTLVPYRATAPRPIRLLPFFSPFCITRARLSLILPTRPYATLTRPGPVILPLRRNKSPLKVRSKLVRRVSPPCAIRLRTRRPYSKRRPSLGF